MFSFLKKEPEAPPLNPSVILAEAQLFLEKEDFEGALAKFDELCSLSVQSPLPLVSRATCRLQLKMYEGVLEDCEKVLKFLNTDIVGHEGESCTTVHSLALLRMAKAYKELGRLDEAKSALMRRNAIEHKLGRASVDDTDGEQVAEDQKSAIELKDKGNEEYKKENWSQALEHYRTGLAYDMYNTKLHGNTCMALIKLKRWSQALKHAEQCIALEPNWAKGYYMKGIILSNESKLEQARDVLQKANAMETNNVQIKTLLDEVEARVEYVETRLRRRKSKKADNVNQHDGNEKTAGDSGNEDTEEQQLVEDVDSDEDYCADGSCRSPQKVKLKITRKDIVNTLVELGVAAVGVGLVWWLVNRDG